MAAAGSDGGPVDRYLDEMFTLLAGTGANGRRLLIEAEEHLVEAAAEASITSWPTSSPVCSPASSPRSRFGGRGGPVPRGRAADSALRPGAFFHRQIQ